MSSIGRRSADGDSVEDCVGPNQGGMISDLDHQSASASGVISIRLTKREGEPFGFRIVWCHPPRVEAVHEGSVAARAGVRPGDLLLSASGTMFSDLSEDESIQLLRDVKKSVDLDVWRDTPRQCTPPENPAGSDAAAVAPRRHRDYTALLHALVTADQALIGRLLAGPPSGSQQPCQQCQRQSRSDQRGAAPEQALSGPDRTEPSRADEMDLPAPSCCAYQSESEMNQSRAMLSDFNLIGPEQQQAILQSIEQIITHVDSEAEEVMRSMVSEDNGFSALRVFYRNLDTSCALFRVYFAVLEDAFDDAACNSMRDELSEFLQLPAQYLRKRLKIIRRLRGLCSSTEAPILQTLITEIANVLEPVEPVTAGVTAEEDMLVSQPQLTYMKGIQPVSLSERRWVHADEVLLRRGRQWRPCYLVLLSDLLLIAQRRRQVVFVTEPPLPLTALLQHTFNVKKKEAEFQLTVPAGGSGRRKPRTLLFRAPSLEAKLAWEDQVQKQMSLMRASQSSTSLASQRSISCDAIIETYKFEDLKPGCPAEEEEGDDRCRRRSSSPPTSDRRRSSGGGSQTLPGSLQRPRPRPRTDTLRQRLFGGAPARPRPLNLKKVSGSAKCSQYLSSLNVPAGERGRVTPVFEGERDMTIADFVKKRQKVLFDVQSADSADGAFETFLLDDEVSSLSATPPPQPGGRHVSYGCVNVVRYRGAPPPPPRRRRPQYNPYLDDRIEEDYPELVGAPVRRLSATRGSPEVAGVTEVGGEDGGIAGGLGGGSTPKRGLLPSPSMKFADDDDLSPTGSGGLPPLGPSAEPPRRTPDGQTRPQQVADEHKLPRQAQEGQHVSENVINICKQAKEQQFSQPQSSHRQRSPSTKSMEKPQNEEEKPMRKASPSLTSAEDESLPAKTAELRTSLENDGGGSLPEEYNSSSESPVLELSLPVSNEDMAEPLCYEICLASNAVAEGKATALAAITRPRPPEPPDDGESTAPLPSGLASSDASCHSPPCRGVRAETDSAAANGRCPDSPLAPEASNVMHADQRTTVSRDSDSPGSQSSRGFVDGESPDAADRVTSTDFTAMQASVPLHLFPGLDSDGDHGKPATRAGAEEEPWPAETAALELSALRDDVTELEDSAYLSRSDELLERHSQKVLSAALSSSLSSLARRAGSIPSSLDRSEGQTDPSTSTDPPLACRSEEVLPAFRCDDDGSVGGPAAAAGTFLTRHGTSCDLVSDVHHGFVPCARTRGRQQRPYGQLVARQVAAFERRADETAPAAPAAPGAPAPRTAGPGALWQTETETPTQTLALWQTAPPVREPADLSPATPSSRGSCLTSDSPATTPASAPDLDSTGDDATLAPSSGDSQNSLFAGLPELEDEVAPDLTLELVDGYRPPPPDSLMPLSDIEEMTEEMDGFVSGSDILSPISEEALSVPSPLQEPPPPQHELFLKPGPRRRPSQIQCNTNDQQDHRSSEHMRNKVRMWANGIDVIPYAAPKSFRRPTAGGGDEPSRGPEGAQPSVEQALEIIADSFRGIGSEDQADENNAEDVDDMRTSSLGEAEESADRKEERGSEPECGEASDIPHFEQDPIHTHISDHTVDSADENHPESAPALEAKHQSDTAGSYGNGTTLKRYGDTIYKPDNGQPLETSQRCRKAEVVKVTAQRTDTDNPTTTDSHLRAVGDSGDDKCNANAGNTAAAQVCQPTHTNNQTVEGRKGEPFCEIAEVSRPAEEKITPSQTTSRSTKDSWLADEEANFATDKAAHLLNDNRTEVVACSAEDYHSPEEDCHSPEDVCHSPEISCSPEEDCHLPEEDCHSPEDVCHSPEISCSPEEDCHLPEEVCHSPEEDCHSPEDVSRSPEEDCHSLEEDCHPLEDVIRSLEEISRSPELADPYKAPKAVFAEERDPQTTKADATPQKTADSRPGAAASRQTEEPAVVPACPSKEAARSAAQQADVTDRQATDESGGDASTNRSEEDGSDALGRCEEGDAVPSRCEEAGAVQSHCEEAGAAPSKCEKAGAAHSHCKEAGEAHSHCEEPGAAQSRCEEPGAAQSHCEEPGAAQSHCEKVGVVQSHCPEADAAPQTAGSGADSPRLVASLRSLLRHLSPGTERRRHLSPATERRRSDTTSRDRRDGRDPSPRAKRFPKFWSHHSRREKSSETTVTHETPVHAGYPPRSGKLNILTRQRPFALATVSLRSATADRISVPQSAVL